MTKNSKQRVFILTSRIYETAGGRTKATIERVMFLQKHFDVHLIEMSATKYPGRELPGIFAKYNTTFSVLNPWCHVAIDSSLAQNYLELLKDRTGNLGDEKIFNGEQIKFVLPTLSGGTIKSYLDDNKIMRLREYHPDGKVEFFALDDQQNIFLRELVDGNDIVARYYLDHSGSVCSGFVVDEGQKKYIYRTTDGELVYSESIADHNIAFLNDAVRAGDVLISDVRYYDNILSELKPGIRKIHVWHEIAANLPDEDGVNPAYKKIVAPDFPMASTDKIVVFTDDARHEYSAVFPHLEERFSVIPYGTTPKPELKDIQRDKNLILSIGRLSHEQKNVSAQIQAFALFHKKHPKTKLHIFGDGNDKDNLVQLVEKLKLKKAVKFCGFTHNANEEFQSAGMMLFSSNHETFGLTILESLSNGTPVASYDVRFGAKTMIDDSRNGVIAKRNTPRSLANAMTKLYDLDLDPKQVKDSIKDAFSRKNFEKRWIDLIIGKTEKTKKQGPGSLVSIAHDHKGFSRQILYLSWIDLQKSYRGALLGWFWVVIRPLIMLGFYWFIIAIGLHSHSVAGKPYEYLPWLVVGLCAWFFVSDMIHAGIGVFRKYKFLITKTKFPVSTIPSIVTISNFITHSILLMIVLVYLYSTGYFALEWIQLPIYVALSFVFMWFWSLLAAPLGAISKDFTQLVKSLMRVLVWVSGILWSISNVRIDWLREVMELNPIYFIAEGYRQSLVYHQWFFENRRGFIIFMCELVLLAGLAIIVYRRSRKEVADIL